jgi:hypothetical protein
MNGKQNAKYTFHGFGIKKVKKKPNRITPARLKKMKTNYLPADSNSYNALISAAESAFFHTLISSKFPVIGLFQVSEVVATVPNAPIKGVTGVSNTMASLSPLTSNAGFEDLTPLI